MAKSVENEGNFEAVLSRLAQGLTIDDKLKANKSGADIFKKNLKAATPRSDTEYKGKTPHIQDAIVEECYPDGRVEVGFSSESSRGYIARFQNDGWIATDRNGKSHKHVPGKYFWEQAEHASRGKIQEAVKQSLKSTIDRKVGKL